MLLCSNKINMYKSIMNFPINIIFLVKINKTRNYFGRKII